jgi:hypothetical protein
VQARLAAAISRRPVAFLVANLALVVGLGALALGAADRVAVGGGLERDQAEEVEVAVVLTPRGPITGAVERQALAVIESGLRADSSVADVKTLDAKDRESTVLVASVHATTAAGGQSAAERVASRIDPGPFELAVGGEPLVQAEARDELESELPELALLAVPLILVVIWLAFGLRLAAAPLLSGATAALGGIVYLRVLPDGLGVTAVGIGVAVAVGLAVAVESCLAVRRAHERTAFAAPETMLAETLGRAVPRLAWACIGGAVAAATLLAIPLPAARSAALGGVAAALLAGAAAAISMTSALALIPAHPREPEPPGGSFADRVRPRLPGRLAGALFNRRYVAWAPALLAVAVLGLAMSQALDTDAAALAAADVDTGSEPAEVASLLAGELPAAEAESLASGPVGPAASSASDLFDERLPWLLGGITLIGLLVAYGASRSFRRALAHGIGAALPAGAVCGLLALAGDGSLPLDSGPLAESPHASVLLAAVAVLGAVGVARAALADARAAVAGTLVAGAAIGALAGAELDAAVQLGVAIAAGLLIDLALVRAVLAPCLERALPARLP